MLSSFFHYLKLQFDISVSLMLAESSWLPLWAADRFFFRNKTVPAINTGDLHIWLWMIKGSFLKCLTQGRSPSPLASCISAVCLNKLWTSSQTAVVTEMYKALFIVLFGLNVYICLFHLWCMAWLSPLDALLSLPRAVALLLLCHVVFHSQWAVVSLCIAFVFVTKWLNALFMQINLCFWFLHISLPFLHLCVECLMMTLVKAIKPAQKLRLRTFHQKM